MPGVRVRKPARQEGRLSLLPKELYIIGHLASPPLTRSCGLRAYADIAFASPWLVRVRLDTHSPLLVLKC